MEQRPEASKGGRPPFQPTDEQRRLVEVMSAGGFQQDAIAYAIGISDDTLRKYFSTEIAAGGSKAHAMVVGNLYRQATKDDPRATAAAIFWAKTRLGWKEPQQVELSGPDGGPLQHSVTVRFVRPDRDNG